MHQEYFDKVKEKIDIVKKEKDKDKIRELIIDIIVDLEKFCHKPDVNIHMVLADARERCKKEIDKPYNK